MNRQQKQHHWLDFGNISSKNGFLQVDRGGDILFD